MYDSNTVSLEHLTDEYTFTLSSLGCSDIQSESSCLSWKKYGYCADGHRYHQYMKDNCKKTCGFCGNAPFAYAIFEISNLFRRFREFKCIS